MVTSTTCLTYQIGSPAHAPAICLKTNASEPPHCSTKSLVPQPEPHPPRKQTNDKFNLPPPPAPTNHPPSKAPPAPHPREAFVARHRRLAELRGFDAAKPRVVFHWTQATASDRRARIARIASGSLGSSRCWAPWRGTLVGLNEEPWRNNLRK